MDKKTRKKGKWKWILLVIVSILLLLFFIGSAEDSDTQPVENEQGTQQIYVDSGNLTQNSSETVDSNYQSSSATPKELIFSGDENNYPIYAFIKDTELITVNRNIFMGEATDMVDITFKSAVGDDSGKMELEVRNPEFGEDDTFLTIHDWEYDNLDEPIIVTFADDMSYIDVLATWNAQITNEQSLYNGHYELEGIYSLDEYVDKFYTDDGFVIPIFEDETQDVSLPIGMIVGDEQIDYRLLSGRYVGTEEMSEISISMYSSPEEQTVGNVEVVFESGEYEYSGEIAELETNVYFLTDNADEILLAVSESVDGTIFLQLYINGELIEEYLMQEYYES